MKLSIKWSSLNKDQRNQIISMHEEALSKKELFQHDLNKRTYQVSAETGKVIFHKDF